MGKWKKVFNNPPVWELVRNKRITLQVGQNPSTGKYDSWLQKDTDVIRWLARDVSKEKALKSASKLRKVL